MNPSGYKRLKKEKEENGRLPNIELLIPVVEFRLRQFIGTEGKWGRINFHVLLSPELDVEFLQEQFLKQLRAKYNLNPRSRGADWKGSVNREGLKQYGRELKKAAPEEEKNKLSAQSDLSLGFNNT